MYSYEVLFVSQASKLCIQVLSQFEKPAHFGFKCRRILSLRSNPIFFARIDSTVMLSSRKKVAVEEGGSKPQRRASLLIPANPAFADPGSSPISRGGILLNPLGGPPPPPFSPSSATSTSSYTSGSTSSLGSERGRGASAIGKRSSISSTGSDDGPGSGTSSPRLKFAPLPVSGRQRSSSITRELNVNYHSHTHGALLTQD